MFRLQDTHWIPKGFHGTIPYPEDGDIDKAIQKAVKTLLPSPYKRMVANDGKYIVVSRDSRKQIVFEIDE